MTKTMEIINNMNRRGYMTNKEKIEMNRLGLIKEYKKLNQMPVSMETTSRMCDIYIILVDKYNMSASEVEALA